MEDVTTVQAEELARLKFFADCSVEDLAPVAAQLRPLTAPPGMVLMRQNEPALSFLLIGSGRAEVTHTAPDQETTVVEVSSGTIVGEIALLRNAPRSATVIATERLTGWMGDQQAFAVMLELPGMMQRLLRTARQRLAHFITPIPVRMRDGSTLFLRPVLPGDSARASAGPVEFSSETLYRRFQSMGDPSQSLMTYLFEVDYVEHFVWVLTDGADGPVVADARFVRAHDDPRTAEVAFLVGDAYQGRGVGSFLLDALAVSAACAGVQRFTAQVLVDNFPMRQILDKFDAHWQHEELNVVSTVIDVPKLRHLSISRGMYRRIYNMARQVVRAPLG